MAKNWAIVIGINKYDNLKALKYAKADAEAIKQWCKTEGRFDEVFLFTEDSPDIEATPIAISTKPTYGKLRRFLRAQFEQPLLGTGDNLWFFFAGHGKRHQERDYLMLSDSDPGDVMGSALSVTWITERLRRCGADNVVLFLDACRSQGARGEGIGLEEPKGVITFYGCEPKQESYELEELQQGAFTYALLEALRIKGTDNCATVERLYNHLRYRVPELVQYYQKPIQRPYAIAEPATKYHLVLITQQATLKDAETLKLDALREERKKNYQLAEQLWIRVLAISPADRDAIDALRAINFRPNFNWLKIAWLQLLQVRVSRRQVLQGMGLTAIVIGMIGLAKIVQELSSSPSKHPPSASPPKPFLMAETIELEYVLKNGFLDKLKKAVEKGQNRLNDLSLNSSDTYEVLEEMKKIVRDFRASDVSKIQKAEDKIQAIEILDRIDKHLAEISEKVIVPFKNGLTQDAFKKVQRNLDSFLERNFSEEDYYINYLTIYAKIYSFLEYKLKDLDYEIQALNTIVTTLNREFSTSSPKPFPIADTTKLKLALKNNFLDKLEDTVKTIMEEDLKELSPDSSSVNEVLEKMKKKVRDFRANDVSKIQKAEDKKQAIEILDRIDKHLAEICEKIIIPLKKGLTKEEVEALQRYLGFLEIRDISEQYYGSFGVVTYYKIENFLNHKLAQLDKEIQDLNVIVTNSTR